MGSYDYILQTIWPIYIHKYENIYPQLITMTRVIVQRQRIYYSVAFSRVRFLI